MRMRGDVTLFGACENEERGCWEPWLEPWTLSFSYAFFDAACFVYTCRRLIDLCEVWLQVHDRGDLAGTAGGGRRRFCDQRFCDQPGGSREALPHVGKNVDFPFKCLGFVLKCSGFVLKMVRFCIQNDEFWQLLTERITQRDEPGRKLSRKRCAFLCSFSAVLYDFDTVSLCFVQLWHCFTLFCTILAPLLLCFWANNDGIYSVFELTIMEFTLFWG